MNVVKRNGESVPYNVDKIHRMVGWAVKGLKGVTVSDVEINANLQKRDGMSTTEIHEVLIDSAVNLINLNNPNYQYVASRLLLAQLRKDVWGGKNPPKLVDFINRNVHEHDVYDEDILMLYTDEEINKKYHKFISPYLSRSYKIEYDEKLSGSKLSEGYFF